MFTLSFTGFGIMLFHFGKITTSKRLICNFTVKSCYTSYQLLCNLFPYKFCVGFICTKYVSAG